MDITQKDVLGAKVFYDADSTCGRWYDAIGNVRKFRYEPGDSLVTVNSKFTRTQDGTSADVVNITAGGGFKLVTDGTEYKGTNLQVTGACFTLASAKPLWFHAKIDLSDATHSDLLIGLAGVETAILAAATAHGFNSTDFKGVGLAKFDEVTTQACYVYSAAGAVAATISMADAVDTDTHDFDIYFDGTNLYFYFDDVLQGSVAGAILPDTVLTPTIEWRAGAAAAKTLVIDEYWCMQVLS